MDRTIPFSFQTPNHFTLSKCPVYPDFVPRALLPSLRPPPELPEPQTGMNCTNSWWRHRVAKVTQPQALGKQSCLQRAKPGRDPARNGEKSNNSLAIHLMETYPTNRTFRNENSLYLLLSTAYFSRLQGDRSTRTVPPSAPYRTTAGNPALGWDGDPAHTIFIPQTDSFTPWGCSLWDTAHSPRGEFITKDHACGKQLVCSVLTMILPSSFWLKKKPCLKWE